MSSLFFKFAINFGDNDFHNTFIPLVKTIGLVENKALLRDKKFIAAIANKLAPTYYILFQNRFEYNGLQNVEPSEYATHVAYIHTENYLKITEDNVLIDDEVDEYLYATHLHNGHCFMNYNGDVYST